MSGRDSTDVHPVAFEVIRSRLMAITEEMRIALQSVSGSPTVTEASDFFTGLFLPDGSFASMGFQVSFQAPVVGHLIRAVRASPHLHQAPMVDADMRVDSSSMYNILRRRFGKPVPTHQILDHCNFLESGY